MKVETIIKIIVRYFMTGLSFAGVVCMVYCFTGIFTKKRLVKLLICTIIGIFFTLGYYYAHKKPNFVQMKEDILYVHPINK